MSQEASINLIDLSEDNQYAISALIRFMYHGEYDAAQVLPHPDYEDSEGRALLLHVRAVSLAQKYFIEPLQSYANALALELMKAWNGVSPGFAVAVHEIYDSTQNVSAGTTLREGAVLAAMGNALALFGPSDENVYGTGDILLEETPEFMKDWATAMSIRNDTLASANTNLEAVNSVLNADNGKLNEKYDKYRGAYDKHKIYADNLKTGWQQLATENANLTTANNNLTTEINSLTTKHIDLAQQVQNRQMPDKPRHGSGSAPDLYLCPNCQVMFWKILKGGLYHHPCFDNGWRGKLDKGGLVLSYAEWQNNLVRKT